MPRSPLRRPRTRLMALGAVAGMVAAAGVLTGGLVLGTSAPALALCDSSGEACVDSPADAPQRVAVVPLSSTSNPVVTVANHDSTGEAEVGVVGFVTATKGAASRLVRPGDGAAATVEVERGQRRTVHLQEVPADARAVVVQVGGTSEPSSSPSPSAGCMTAACDRVRVAFTLQVDPVTRSEVTGALQQWSRSSSTTMPDGDAVDELVAQVGGTARPAHLAAAISPQPSGLKIAWQLDPGTESVTAVRILRTGVAADGSRSSTVDRPASSGDVMLDGLVPGTAYSVAVAPVIEGATGAPVTLTATVLAGDPSSATSTPTSTPTPTESPTATPSASASAGSSTATPSPTSTSTPRPAPSSSAPPSGTAGGSSIPPVSADWKPLFQQTFDKDASIGSFGSAYPGWSGYDGGTDTSHTTSRPASQTGLWNNQTTSSVHDGVFDCRVHTEGQRPQVCALTPSIGGRSWSGQMYGRYSVRFKTDPTPGYKIAWLLWPSSNNWSQGEIDFPEGSLNGTVTGTSHDVNGNPSRNAWLVDTRMDMNRWRTATIEWRPGRITYILDDQSWTTTDSSALPRDPMRWALQTETEISSQAPSQSAQGHVLIDWLAGYSWQG